MILYIRRNSAIAKVLAYSANQNSAARIVMHVFIVEKHFDIEKLSIETLIEVMQPVVWEKFMFQFLDENSIRALWAFSVQTFSDLLNLTDGKVSEKQVQVLPSKHLMYDW